MRLGQAPTTVCHGEFRADNLMFDDRAGAAAAVAVLDWQISYRGPSITDEEISSPDLANGDCFSKTFAEPGTFGYFCGIHSGMTGTVTVTE